MIRNSLVNGEWGNEEREGKNPFEKGVGFDLEIKNEEYAFQVRFPMPSELLIIRFGVTGVSFFLGFS